MEPETHQQRIDKQVLLLAMILAGSMPPKSLHQKLQRIVKKHGGTLAPFIGQSPEQLVEMGFSDTQAVRVFAAIALPNAGRHFVWGDINLEDG